MTFVVETKKGKRFVAGPFADQEKADRAARDYERVYQQKFVVKNVDPKTYELFKDRWTLDGFVRNLKIMSGVSLISSPTRLERKKKHDKVI